MIASPFLKGRLRGIYTGDTGGEVEKMKDEKFEKLRQGIQQQLLKANQHFKICWGISLASEDIARAIDIHSAFFYYTMWSNNESFCLTTFNVLKPDDKTANFTKLFNHIRNSKNLLTVFDLKEIEGMKTTIKSHESLIKRIKVIRDQYIAHNQLKKKHLEGETTYTYEEGKKLLEDLNNILNTLSHKYDRSIFSWDTSPRLNVEYVLRSLTERYEDQINRSTNLDHQTI